MTLNQDALEKAAEQIHLLGERNLPKRMQVAWADVIGAVYQARITEAAAAIRAYSAALPTSEPHP